mmetsp:Transcript_29934/g.82147  ORF Transcript_29934/g.82147 Transcript_29934/m.82147 type:complete len:599 (-) Transcript_29934:57-1853(-)
MSEFANEKGLEAWLLQHRVTARTASATAGILFRHGFLNPLTLLGIATSDLTNSAGIAVPHAQELSNALKNEYAQQQTSPFTPRPTRRPPQIPPSTGKEPKAEATPKKSPSSDEGMEEGLSFVMDSPGIRVSSNSVSIDFVEELHRIVSLEEVDERFSTAAEYVYNNWNRQRIRLGRQGVHKNERWLTGIVCNALNLALQAEGGLVALHQGCIGERSTHSDVSVTTVGIDPSPPLLVCEGKQDSERTIRTAVQGQLFNELVRHRRIFSGGSPVQTDFRPVLLMALNSAYISLDLAFPTTKDGNLSRNEWISSPESNVATTTGDVVFFTIPITLIHIDNAVDGPKKMARLFRFLYFSLKKLATMKEYSRDQWKTPWRTSDTTNVMNARKYGDNVTVVNDQKVYKEFCYYLRQDDGFNSILMAIDSRDQRRPPPPDLLQRLGDPYQDWVCKDYAGGWFQVLQYDLIPGDAHPSTLVSWRSLLKRVAVLHDAGYVHGDILPRNLVFSRDEGYLIDFDLMRPEDELYVRGYNHVDFVAYRHPDAQAHQGMKKTHDVHALAMIGLEYFFRDDDSAISKAAKIDTVESLIQFFDSFAPQESFNVR